MKAIPMLASLCCALFPVIGSAQSDMHLYAAEHSAARNWNEILLAAIRVDYARPTVHARNLFHSSVLMYDAWSIFSSEADTYLAGDTSVSELCVLSDAQRDTFRNIEDPESAASLAISYGMFKLLKQRFEASPGAAITYQRMYNMADALSLDRNFDDADISGGDPASLGIYLANCVIDWGSSDGSNEENDYANSYYSPANDPLNPAIPGSPGMAEPNRWQPLALDIFVDQAGNFTDTPPFLGAEWGKVRPFALSDEDRQIYVRDGEEYHVYHDPGAPALLSGDRALPAEYQWGHTLVALWSAHLDPSDGVTMDISPSSIGNTATLPDTVEGLRDFYQALDGGVAEAGHRINPVTGNAYASNTVLRGDYTRVLAEFWADGPESETPPGHWFVMLNEFVSDHPDVNKRFEGQGDLLSDLEWDIKAYFTLSGAVHDSAVTAWGIKGWYDYVRPISALRYMASLGQSSDPGLANYHAEGLPLVTGRIELVESGDALAGDADQHLNKLKIYAWKGPDAIANPDTDTAGVDWILAENWWPYQRPSFVTPPFAGYVSGHSTFSRAAAEVLTRLSGDEYFPGGMAEFTAKKNEFLVFEEGPSTDVTLQWATYVDASDQTSLSRLWGGIHPPVDDVPGRRIGIDIGIAAFEKSKSFFQGNAHPEPEPTPSPATPPEKPGSGGGGGSFNLGTTASLFLLVFISRIAKGNANLRRRRHKYSDRIENLTDA